MSTATDHSYRLDPTEQATGVSWGAIAAGAVVAAALSLALLALGVGLSAISPWSGSGASATTFKIGSGVYLAVVAGLTSTVGGYLAARLRTKWTTLDPNEVFFRDTAHGLITWAFATVLSAAALGTATTKHCWRCGPFSSRRKLSGGSSRTGKWRRRLTVPERRSRRCFYSVHHRCQSAG
jgi:hypothetical protein